MITENLLTSYVFKEISGALPASWDLTPYIPEGVGLLRHLRYRYRMPNAYWGGWVPVTGFDRMTGHATVAVPNGIESLEFKRSTPRYELVKDPQAKTSKVAQPDLQLNADQGMFVAIEWSADYGVNAHDELVSGRPPVSLGGTMNTQLHFGPEVDYTGKVWNFHFSGGYMHPKDVRVQIKVAGVWQAVVIDYLAYDHTAPVDSKFWLFRPFQLYLDFGALASSIEAMVIYRRTPREFPVSTPHRLAQITAPAMLPTATQAFFVAVELAEEVSKLVPDCECKVTYTSRPYSLAINEGLTADLKPGSGTKMQDQPRSVDELTAGLGVVAMDMHNLVSVFSWRDDLTAGVVLANASLVTIVKDQSYKDDALTSQFAVSSASMISIVVDYVSREDELTARLTLIGASLV